SRIGRREGPLAAPSMLRNRVKTLLNPFLGSEGFSTASSPQSASVGAYTKIENRRRPCGKTRVDTRLGRSGEAGRRTDRLAPVPRSEAGWPFIRHGSLEGVAAGRSQGCLAGERTRRRLRQRL